MGQCFNWITSGPQMNGSTTLRNTREKPLLAGYIEACFAHFFSLTSLMRSQLVASLGWRLISLAEKDLATSSNCSGKQISGVILKLQLSKKDSLTDKKACLVFSQLHPCHTWYKHLNSYLQTGFLLYLLEVGDLFSPISLNSQSQHWWYCILYMRWQHDHAVQKIRKLTCAHFLKVMFLCVQLGWQIRHFHSLNLRLVAAFPH